MMPTAARLAANAAKHTYQTPAGRVGANFAGWAVIFGVFMGWPVMVQAYQYKVNSDPTKLH